MAATSLTPVEFHGATLTTTLIDGVPYVALRPICEAIGLDADAQIKRIKRHAVLGSSAVITTVDAARGNHTLKSEVVMLPLNKLNGWLFGVSVRRVKPELRERLTQYQADCFDALARHFGPAPQLSGNAGQLPGPAQLREALNMAMVVSGYVQQDVARAVLAGGDDWKHQRYLISFVTDSAKASPPIVERLLPDTMVLKKPDLIELMANITADVWTEMKLKLERQQDIDQGGKA